MSINEQRFENIFMKTQEQLHKYLIKKLTNKYRYAVQDSKKGFIYAEGNIPIMLVAHLDTVHKETAKDICKSDNGVWMSPQGIGGDDRCGVEMILSILDTGRRPHVLFTHDEEIGGVGAEVFLESSIRPKLNFIVEFDRMGDNDAVFYDCANEDFTKFIESFGFKENYGSFSDISVIAPAFKVAAVNISSGYHNAHTKYEYVSIPEMNLIFEKSLKLIDSYKTQYEYIELKFNKYHSPFSSHALNSHYLYDDFDDYYNDSDEFFLCQAEDDDSFIDDTDGMLFNDVPINGYIEVDGIYYDGTMGDFLIDKNNKVYASTVYGIIYLKNATAFNERGTLLKFKDKNAFSCSYR